MLGLVGYDSSDEEEGKKKDSSRVKQVHHQEVRTQPDEETPPSSRPIDDVRAAQTISPNDAAESHTQAVTVSTHGAGSQDVRPMLGPTRQPSNSPGPMNGSTISSRPQSPYSSTRTLIRDLTLPPVPNLDIPPSPPGSPRPSTTAKFAHFLQLKRQGVHFNEKLARSSALKNPSLFEKLARFAGIDEQDQYVSTLPPAAEDVWDPARFPSWAYKEELARSQQEILKRKEEEMKGRREEIEFVRAAHAPAASASASREGSARPTPPPSAGNTAGRIGIRKSAAERVMAGLDGERTKSPFGSGSDGDKKRPRDDIYGPYDATHLQTTLPTQHTQSPIVTGTSVIAVKYADGVVIAADNLASYGSLARFTDVKRLLPFAGTSIVGVGGDVSDMQYLSRLLSSLDIRESYNHNHHPNTSGGVGPHLNAANLHTYLSKVLYKRRSDFNPLWNQILVAGLDGDDKPFLASADLLGTTFSAPTLATGFGAHLAQPILRRLVEDEKDVPGISREMAEKAVRECLKVLFYRDARSLDRFSLGVVTKGGVELLEDERLEGQSWAFAEGIRGYGTQVN
ncbi:MAG: Proteasome subunit beta type-7 [Peltula sp. TS41687]|nr:MAG: Proteasome subunit beta type-7 [Peltula sp. TS41687]